MDIQLTQKDPVETTGIGLTKLKSNMVEELNLYFEDKEELDSENDIKVTLDMGQFYTFYKVINAKSLTERIGMNQSLLAQYITGKKKPTASQTQRILKGYSQLAVVG